MAQVVLDNSAVNGQPLGAKRMLMRASVATADLTSFAPKSLIAEHVHDVPYLSLHVLGSYLEQGDAGAAAIDAPAASYHPAGTAHLDSIGSRGLTTVVISFDPTWLNHAVDASVLPSQSTYWLGGATARAASALANQCLAEIPTE